MWRNAVGGESVERATDPARDPGAVAFLVVQPTVGQAGLPCGRLPAQPAPGGVARVGPPKPRGTGGPAPIRTARSPAGGATAIAPTGLRSVTTSPPAFAIAARICAGVAPPAKRTMVIP